VNRFVAWIGSLLARARGRVRSIGSVGFVAVAVIGLVVAMFLADGFRATTLDLENPGVWVTNSGKKLVGRFNTQAQDVDTVVQTGIDGVDVAQDGSNIVAFGGGKLTAIDPKTGELRTGGGGESAGGELPADASVQMSGGRYLVVLADGKAWTGRPEDLHELVRVKPHVRGSSKDLVVLGRDGTVAALTRGGSVTLLSPSGERSKVELDGLDDVPETAQLTLVGRTPAVLDPASGRLYLPGADPVDVGDLGDAPALQLPGDDADRVAVAAANGLGSVPLSGGTASLDVKATPAAGAVRPVYVNGCTYGAWADAGPHMVVRCASGRPIDEPLDGVTGRLGFRVNRSSVALNQLDSGELWIRVGDEIKKVSTDWEPSKTPDTGDDHDEQKPDQVVDLSDKQEPPVANPDEGWGARRNRPSVIPVLDNDTDVNGDVLTVELVDPLPAGVQVTTVQQGRAVQVIPGEDAPATVTFQYRANDGTAKSNVATVSVDVVDKGNSAPERRENVSQRDFTVVKGTAGAYDVLPDWRDPEGDPIVLSGATPDDPATGAAQTVPTGRLTFTATGGAPGARTVNVEVSDIPPSGASETATGTVAVKVVGDTENLPPTLQPDYAVGAAGTAITVEPLRNDTDPDGDPLRLLKVIHPTAGGEGLTWPPNVSAPEAFVDDGRIVVQPPPTFEGSLIFKYQATDDFNKAAEALVRVDVVARDRNHAPNPAVDLVLLPSDGSARSVDLLVNDFDADGDVMMVTGVSGGAVAGIRSQLLEHRRLRVSSEMTIGSPVVLQYTVTDGVDQATGKVIVVKSPAAAENAVPVTAPDTATVRAGDIVSIPVLANDVDPDGDQLRLGPEVSGLEKGQGAAFVSGSVVRFVAPDTPGTARLSYSVTDGTDVAARPWSSEYVVITVKAAEDNRPPSPRTVEARVLAGNTIKVTIPLSGIDPDGDSVGLVGLTSDATPTRGRVVLPLGTDSITYEAFPIAAGSGSGGPDQLTYQVRDSRGREATGTVRLVVGVPSSSNPPVADDDEVRLAPGNTALVPVMANDYDPDGDPIRLADPALDRVPDGVGAEVVGSRVRVTAPGEIRQVEPIGYFITDGRSFPASTGAIKITVDPDAPGLPPVARDDVAQLPADQTDLTSISVDVTANDEDPDGDPTKLKVEIVGGAGKVADGRLEVTPGDAPRVVVYRITDEQGLHATAVVRVPRRGDLVDRPPELVKGAPAVEVHAGGDPATIELAEYVKDPEGKAVQLTQGLRVRLAPGGVGQIDQDALAKGQIRIAAPAETAPGPGAVTFEVTDAADVNEGNHVTLSIPFTVIAAPGNEPPPRLRPVAVTVGAGDGPVTVDLATQLEPGSGSPADVEFAVGTVGEASQLDVSASGSKLTIEAPEDAPVGGAPVQLSVSVFRGGQDPTTGTVSISVVPTTRRLPECADAEIPDANAGAPSTVDLVCTNPFPDTELVFGRPTSSVAGVDVAIDGTRLMVTPKAKFVGQAVVTYPVTDSARRTVNGVARVTVRDVPSAPGAPVVGEQESQQVTLQWTASDPHGAEITRYLVEAPEMTRPFECPASTTTCTVTGLTNDVTYHFRVVAENEVGRSDPGPVATARPDQRPEPPTDVRLTFDESRLDGKLTATWTAARTQGSKVEKYRIRVSPPIDGGDPVTELGAVTEVQLDGLENGTAYTVSVQAVNKSLVDGSDWATSNIETPATAPGSVARPTAVPVDDPLGMRINVSWTPPASDGGAPITGYRVNVYRSGQCQPGATPYKQMPVVQPNQASGYLIDLGDKYSQYQVAALPITRATDNQGNSALGPATFNCSSPVSAPSKPGPVGIVTVTANRDGSNVGLDGRLLLQFAAPDNGGSPIAGYEASQDGGPFNLVSSANTQVSGNQVTLTIGGLRNGTGYSFQVRARNGTRYTGDPSPATTRLSPYAPLGQPAIAVIGSDQGGVTFRITPPPDNGRSPTVSPSGDQRVAGACGSPVSITATATDGAGQRTTATGSGSTAPCPVFPTTISDFFLGGTWVRSSTAGGTWYSKTNRPADAITWVDSGGTVTVRCATPGGSYDVKFANGSTQRWSWHLRLDDGNYVRSAVAQNSDGQGRFPPC